MAKNDKEELTETKSGQGSLDPEARKAGDQFGEAPGPIPSIPLPTEKPATVPDGTALPRTDVKEVQPAPVVAGTHRVVVDLAPADPGVAAITSAAERTGSIGPGQSLTTLARFHYGDENLAAWIFEANRDTMTSPDATTVGQAIRIPAPPEGHKAWEKWR